MEDKSLGCTQKGGTAIVMDVLKYTEPIKVKGLNLLSTSGNDLVASSGKKLRHEESGFKEIAIFKTGVTL